MKRELVFVSNGTAAADVLVGWLLREAPEATHVPAVDEDDVSRIVHALRNSRAATKIVAVSAHPQPEADLSANDALATVTRLLSGLGAFEQRVQGPEEIDHLVERGDSGADSLRQLVRALKGGRRRKSAASRGRRGRPKGSGDPFRGVGFEVCVRLLFEPARGWSERELAEELDRSPYGVHRALEELERRGYVVRRRGDTRPRDPIALRDELAVRWARRLGSGDARPGDLTAREGQAFLAPEPEALPEALFDSLDERGVSVLLAGPSALSGGAALTGGPITVYSDEAGEHMRELGFRAARTMGDVVVWSTPEPNAIFLAPRQIDGLPATNHVITYLDLVASQSDRYVAAADALWEDCAA